MGRKPFSTIVGRNFSEQIENTSQEIANTLNKNIPSEAIKDIATTITESAEILGTKIPQVKPYNKSGSIEGSNLTHAAGLQVSVFPLVKPKIVVTGEYLEDIKAAYESSNPQEQRVMKKHIRETFAEEVGHLYVHNNYPIVSRRGEIANKLGGEIYDKDRDEEFSKKFAEGYSRCKESLDR